MPTPNVASSAQAQQQNNQQNGQGSGDGQQQPVVPFIRASAKRRERFFDVTRQQGSSDVDLGIVDVPAFGFMRSLVIQVDATGGSSDGTADDIALANDGPWTALKNITLSEPNGATIAGFNNGHDLYLAQKYGGYRAYNDPRANPSYTTSLGADGNYSFMYRIPLELNERSAIGSLPNQNSSATFKLSLTLAKTSDVLTGTVATPPDVRVRVWLESWEQPQRNSGGMRNAVDPPAVNTTQYWSPQTYNVHAGEQGIRLTRMGNYIRQLVFVARDSSGVRTDSIWPDLTTLYLDARPLDQVGKALWRDQMYERYGYSYESPDTQRNQDTGVFVYDFCHEFTGQVGHENRDLWLPTLGSTRLELQGSFGSQGTLHVYTNDVSVAGVVF